MKLSRRGFFGIGAGAVASGPTLAKSLSADAVGRNPGSFSSGYPAIASNDSKWKAKRALDLRNWIKAGRPEDAQERQLSLLHSLETRERFRLDSLRSVSPVNRARIFVEGQIARNEQIRRVSWEYELSELTGGIL